MNTELTVNLPDEPNVNTRGLRRLFRAAMDFGMSREQLIERTKMAEDQIDQILSHKEGRVSSRINMGGQQCKCPTCKNIILSPEAWFSIDDAPDRTKRGFSYCYGCVMPLTFYTTRSGIVTVEESALVTKVPPERLKDAGISRGTGISLITDVFEQQNLKFDNIDQFEYEVRVGIAVFGSVNFDASCGACPFDPNFHDNYCSGKGATLDDALAMLADDIDLMTGTLWS
jgi:hypothetical protein